MQLVLPARHHCINPAERSVQTFKNHFPSTLYGNATNFEKNFTSTCMSLLLHVLAPLSSCKPLSIYLLQIALHGHCMEDS